MQDFSVFAERERAGWSDTGIVDAYVERFGPVTAHVARALTARVAAPGRTVLDLCCGHGELTAMLADAGVEVTGLDFSPEMLALARERAPRARLVEGDAGALPFEDGSFDAVVCNFGMMHLPDQPRALGEIARVLRPDGRFVMATWAGPQVSPAFGTVFGAIKAHADFSVAPPQPDLFHFAVPGQADETLRQAGLKMTAHETVTPAWELSDPAELYDIFLTATVGASMLIKGQRPEVIAAIREQITATVVERFADGGGYRVPVPVSVITAATGR